MQLSTVRFLVVEDHEVQRRLLTQILANLGATDIEAADDGHSALRIIAQAQRPIDIMITDLSMPGMDGMELIRRVGEDAGHIAIILTSALEPAVLASVANMAQSYQVKLLGVVKKPPSAVKLAPLIRQFLDGRQERVAGSSEQFTLAEIADAFANDEFEPLFEPTVSLVDLWVRGFQAVPFWRHASQGLLPAHRFLPAVQAYGLADEFVWAMLRKSAAQSAQFKREGRELKVAVNLALGSLSDPYLAPRAEKLALDEGAEPASLVLGVGQSAVDVATDRALENLIRLRIHGFELAVDEFGAGSLATEQLERVAFNELKISREFVAGKGKAKAKPLWGGLAQALDTVNRLKLAAVADGVATPDDWNLLQELKCELAQGPLIAKPMPAHDVAGWLQNWPPKAQRGVWTPTPML